ncbi:MAG: Ig-like domain-containing protein, partial [Bifidobacteriaceae bacterium]|nr:Ig-like domain-containing protein [Bifidobacteriaceae bacterium]
MLTPIAYTQTGVSPGGPGLPTPSRTSYEVTNTPGVPADGVSYQTVTVTMLDTEERPVTGQAQVLSAESASETAFGTFTEMGEGVYTAKMFAALPGTYRVSVMVGGDFVASGPGNSIAEFVEGVPESLTLVAPGGGGGGGAVRATNANGTERNAGGQGAVAKTWGEYSGSGGGRGGVGYSPAGAGGGGGSVIQVGQNAEGEVPGLGGQTGHPDDSYNGTRYNSERSVGGSGGHGENLSEQNVGDLTPVYGDMTLIGGDGGDSGEACRPGPGGGGGNISFNRQTLTIAGTLDMRGGRAGRSAERCAPSSIYLPAGQYSAGGSGGDVVIESDTLRVRSALLDAGQGERDGVAQLAADTLVVDANRASRITVSGSDQALYDLAAVEVGANATFTLDDNSGTAGHIGAAFLAPGAHMVVSNPASLPGTAFTPIASWQALSPSISHWLSDNDGVNMFGASTPLPQAGLTGELGLAALVDDVFTPLAGTAVVSNESIQISTTPPPAASHDQVVELLISDSASSRYWLSTGIKVMVRGTGSTVATSSFEVTASNGATADGYDSETLTVRLNDASGQPVGGLAAHLRASATPAWVGQLIEGETGVYTAPITSTVAGTIPVSVTYRGRPVAAGVGKTDAAFNAGAVDVFRSTVLDVSGANTLANANVDNPQSVNVTARDSFSNLIPGASVRVLSGANIEPPVDIETTTAESGVATVQFQPERICTRCVVYALIDGNEVLARTYYTLWAGAAVLEGSTFTVDSRIAYANNNDQVGITYNIKDQFGNNATNPAGVVAVLPPELSCATVSIPCISVRTLQPGEHEIGVTIGGTPIPAAGNAIARFRDVGNPDLAAIKVNLSRNESWVSDSVTASLRVVDEQGNPLYGIPVSFAIEGPEVSPASGSTSSASNGYASLTFTPNLPGDYTVSATIDGAGLSTDPATLRVLVDPNRTTNYYISDGEATADQRDWATLALALYDSYGRGITSTTGVEFEMDSDVVMSGCYYNSSRRLHQCRLQSSVPGEYEVSVSYLGQPVPLSAGDNTVRFAQPEVPPEYRSTYSVTEGDRKADGEETHTVTVWLRDSDGAPVVGAADSIRPLTLGVGQFTESEDTGGMYTATFLSAIAGQIKANIQYSGRTIPFGGEGVSFGSFVPGAVWASNTSLQINKTTLSTGEEATATVRVGDEYGNRISGAVVRIWSVPELSPPLDFTSSTVNGTLERTFRSNQPGEATIYARVEGLDLTPIPVEFTGPDVPVAGNSELDISSPSVGVNELAAASVLVRNQRGEPMPGVDVSFSMQPDAALPGGRTVRSGPDGVASVGFDTSQPGVYTLTATIGGDPVPGSGEITLTVGERPGTVVSIPDSDFDVSADADVPVGGVQTVTVRLRDAGLAAVADKADLLAATAGDATVSEFTESETTPGTYTAEVTSTTAGSFPVSVTYDGADLSAGLANALAVFVPADVTLARLVVTPTLTGVGGLVQMMLIVTDGSGAGKSDVPVRLWSEGMLDMEGRTGASGTYAFSYGSPVPIEYEVHGWVEGAVVEGSPVLVRVLAIPPGTVVSIPDSDFEVSADADVPVGGIQTVTVRLRDADLVAVPGKADLLRGTAGDATVSEFTESIITAGTYTAQVTSTTAGSFPVAVTFDGDALSAGQANTAAVFVQPSTPGPVVSIPDSDFEVSADADIPVGGVQTVTVRLRDADLVAVPDKADLLRGTAGDATVSEFTESIITAGTYTAEVTSTTAGSFTVAVTFDGEALSAGGANTAAVFVEPSTPGPVVSVPDSDFEVSTDADIPVGGVQTVTVRLRDADLVAVGDKADMLRGTAGDATVSEFTESTTTAGTYTAEVTSTTAGSFTVAVTFDGEALSAGGANTAAVFVEPSTPGPVVSIPDSDFEVSADADIPVGGVQTVTVRLRDADLVAVPDKADLLAATAGDATVSAFTESTTTTGTYTAEVTSTTAGSFTVSVTFDGEALSAGLANAVAVFVPADETLARLVVTPTSVGVGGSVQMVLVVSDGSGAGKSGVPVRLWSDGLFDVSGWTGDSGAFAYEYVTRAPNEFAVNGWAEGAVVEGSPTLVQVSAIPPGTVVSIPDSDFEVSTDADIPVGGTQTVTVRLRDADLVPVGDKADLLAGTAGDATVSEFTESTTTAGTYTAEVTSTTAGSFTVAVTFDGEALSAGGANTAAVFVEPSTPGPVVSIPDSDFEVSTDADVPVGGVQTVTVRLRDADLVAVGDKADLLAGTAGDATVSEFTESETTAGTYTAEVTSTTAGSFTVAVTFDGEALSAGLANAVAVFVPADETLARLDVFPTSVGVGGSVQMVLVVSDGSGAGKSGVPVRLWSDGLFDV